MNIGQKDKVVYKVNDRYTVCVGPPVLHEEGAKVLCEDQMLVYKSINVHTGVVENEQAVFSAALRFCHLAGFDCDATLREIEEHTRKNETDEGDGDVSYAS